MKKLWVVVLGLSMLLVGCSLNQTGNSVTLIAELESYSPLMSSTPGLPLIPELKDQQTPQEPIFHWTTEQGQFLKWDQEGVEELGQETQNDGKKLYWCVDFEEKREITPFKIILEVLGAETGELMAKTFIMIDKNAEGFYYVDQGKG